MSDSTFQTWKPFCLYGLVVAGFCAYILQQNIAARGWPTAPGTVLATENKPDPKAVSLDGTVATYQQVDYVYPVAGRDYRSRRISYIASQDQDSSLTKDSPYSPGQEIKVFYNPRRPTDAYVKPLDAHDDLWLIFVLAGHVVLVLAGLGCIFSSKLNRSRNSIRKL
jgi:hypothetical protein